jgi:Xaa-Pro aminopeptidase
MAMKDKGADYYILSSLGDIAWLFNIRGEDVKHTPLVLCYGVITQNDGVIFIDKNKIPKELGDRFKSINIELMDYNSVADYLIKLPKGVTVYYNPGVLNSWLSGIIPKSVKVKRGGDITTDLKAIKNQVEIKNTRVSNGKRWCCSS